MSPELVRVKDSSPSAAESSFRELDHVFLQTQTRIWLGEVLHVRFDENIAVADLLADGEVLLQVSKVVRNMYCLQHGETKYCKPLINERRKLGKHGRKYMPYLNVDKFLKVCQFFGLTGVDIFSPSDVVEKQDIRRVCMCVRSLSKKARSKHLNVPDFDVVTHNITMPTELVGGIRRSLEKALCSMAESVVYSSRRGSIEKYLQRGDIACQGDIFEEFYGVESNFGPSEFGSLFPTPNHNDSLLLDFLSRRSSNGSSEMNESIEMSPCSVFCCGNNEVASLHLVKSPQSCLDSEIHMKGIFYCRHWKSLYPIDYQNYEKNCPPNGRESDTFSEGFSSIEVDDFLKNELSDSYTPLQENVPSHIGMDSLHGESTSESSDEIHDNNRKQDDRQFQSLEILAFSNDPAKVNFNVEKLDFMGYNADQPLGGDFKHLDIFEEVFEPKIFSDNSVMEEESANFSFLYTQYGFNRKHQEVKLSDGYISQVENARMSGHASGFDSCATTNKGAADNDFRGHKDGILMCVSNSSPNTFTSCTDIEKNSTATVSDLCVRNEVSKCSRSIEEDKCRSISGSISAAAWQSEPERVAGSSIAARNDFFYTDAHYKCAFLNGGISSFSDKQICDLELWTCARQYDLLDEEDMQRLLVKDLVSCNGTAEILTLRLASEIEIGNSLSEIYADNQVVNGVVSKMEDSDSLKNRIMSEPTCSSTIEYQSFMSNIYTNSSGENRIHRNSSFFRTQCNQLPMCVDSTAQGDAHNSSDASVEMLMLQADESARNCVTALDINMGCFPNLIEAFCDDQTSGGGNSEAMNEDKLRISSDQVVKEGEEMGADANQMKSKLHKRLILSSFAGGAVFGVLFFVYHISKRRTLKGHYNKNTKGKGKMERPFLYQHQEAAIMGQQKPKEAAVYSRERLMLKG